MPRISSQRMAVCEEARRLTESGRIPRETLPFIDLALDGNDNAYTILLRTICGSRLRREQLSRIVELPAKPEVRGARRFSSRYAAGDECTQTDDSEMLTLGSHDMRFMPHIAERIALRRATEVGLVPLASAPEIESYIFDEIEYSRSRIPDPVTGKTIEEKVRRALVARLSRFLINALRTDNNAFSIPPPPLSQEFLVVMGETLIAQEEVIQSWTQWPEWNSVVCALFAASLAYGEAPGQYASAVLRREATVELWRKWYDDLTACGIDLDDIDKSFGLVFRKRDVREIIRATAELGRFTSGAHGRFENSPEAAKFLASEINMLHGLDPLMEGNKFLKLLIPYAPPMTVESIKAAISQKGIGITDSEQARARIILAWHTSPAEKFADGLRILIERNKRYRHLGAFCSRRLGVDSAALYAKIELLRQAGADVQPVLLAITSKFPNPRCNGPAIAKKPVNNDNIAVEATPEAMQDDSMEQGAASAAIESGQLMLPCLGISLGGVKMAK